MNIPRDSKSEYKSSQVKSMRFREVHKSKSKRKLRYKLNNNNSKIIREMSNHSKNQKRKKLSN